MSIPSVKVFCILFNLFLGIQSFAQLPCGQNIDFNTWSQEGESTSGIWDITNGGSSVEQNLNGTATWFVSPNDFFNVLIQGSIQVNTSSDDDLVGFVFGYQNPIGPLTAPSSTYVKSYFFDWKQGTQTFVGMSTNEGFALYEMDGFFDFTNIVTAPGGSVYPEFWERINSPIMTVIDTDYGNNGWNDYQQYDFQLKYTADSIVIWIDGAIIFEESGCYEPGKFGFYNHSQDAVIYSNFTYDFEYDFSSDSLLCVNDTAFFEIGSGCSNYFPPSNTFNWEFGDNVTATGIDPSHVYSTPSTYNVELITSDPFGCVDTTFQTIQVLQYPTPSAGIDDTSCFLSYNLSASPNIGSWSGPAGAVFSSLNSANTTVNVNSSGFYTFYWEATNAAGCSAVDSVSILFNEHSLSAIITEPTCNGGSNGGILLTIQGGAPPLSYQWSTNVNSQTTNSAVNLPSDSYSVSITDNYGCVIDSTFNLSEPSEFNSLITVVSSDCDSANGSASILNVIGGTGPYLFDWGNGPTSNNSNQNLSGGTNSLTIIDSEGCDSLLNFTIPTNPFSALIDSISNITCYGANDGIASVSGPSSQQNYFFQWSISSGNQTTSTVTNLSAGSHAVIVTTGTGCIDTLNLSITEPTELLITQITDVSGCIGDTVLLFANVVGGTPPYTYLWGNGIGSIQSPGIVISQSEQIAVTITDVNGCVVSDTAFVNALGSPVASFLVDSNVSCLRPAHIFTFYNASAPQGLSTIWDFGDQSFGSGDTVAHTYSTSGVYSVNLTISNGSGCFDSYTEINLITIFPNPIAEFSFTPSQVTTFNSTIDFIDLSYDNVHNWNWEFGDFGSSNDQNPTFSFPQLAGTHIITLKVENIYGCIDSTSKQIIIHDDINLYVPNTFTPDGDEFNQNWMIYASGIDLFDFEVIIYNRWGEQIWKSNDISIPWDGTFNGFLVPDGVYTWVIKTKSISTDEKLEFIGHINILR